MGLVFVLLIGEIDLAAGTASGLTAAVLALHLCRNGNLLGAMGTTVFVLRRRRLALAVVLAAWLRIWAGAVFAALGLLLLVVGFPPNAWLEMLLAVCVGVVIGMLTGFLVAKVGMPSFVVTLALFIAWQGVILQLIGDGGTLGLRDPVLVAVANGSMSTVGSWLLFLVAAGGYAAVLLNRQVSPAQARPRRPAHRPGADQDRRRWCCSRRSPPSCSRSTARRAHPHRGRARTSCRSCWCCSSRARSCSTAPGSAGTSTPSAATGRRRAGPASTSSSIRAAVFVISSALAAIGAIIYSSKVGSVSPSAGGGNTLLFAVGAAVIGGTSLFGGRGRISNAVIGGAVLATVNNGLGLLGQPASVVFLVNGIVLLLAAGVDVLSRRRSADAGR